MSALAFGTDTTDDFRPGGTAPRGYISIDDITDHQYQPNTSTILSAPPASRIRAAVARICLRHRASAASAARLSTRSTNRLCARAPAATAGPCTSGRVPATYRLVA